MTEGSGSLKQVGQSAVWDNQIDGVVCFQNTLLRLRPRRGVANERYLAWWARHAFESGLCASAANGANIFHLSAERLRMLPIALPSIRTQVAIADYLDSETARIDTLVAKKRQIALLLGERWTVTCMALVTGHTGKRAPSGSWFGDIPDGWNVQPLKALTDFVNGCAFKPDDWGDTGIPIIRIENLNGGKSFNLCDRAVDPRYRVTAPALLFGWSGNRGTSFGPFRWNRPGTYLLNQHIFRLPAVGVDSDWLYWALRAATPYVEELAHGIIGMVHITKEKLGRILIPVPPISEQVRLGQQIDAMWRLHSALRERLEAQVALLREHRQALITAVVTGQADVPGVAA